jgi:hypothetical protein
MRGWALLFACLTAGQAAGAESATEAMTAFGLFGSWSLDCSKPMTCDEKTCGSRTIYEVLPSGQPMSRFVTGATASGPGKTIESEIQAATRIADDKIKIISTQLQSSGVTWSWVRQPGERWEFVLIKAGNKYRLFSAKRDDGKKILAEDGFGVRPPPNTNFDQLPTSWIRTTQETPWFEKCAATADAVVVSGVIVRSDASGYAVTFPAQPKEDVQNTPAGRLIINFARDGDSMFLASEAATPLADASSGLESSVTSLVNRFAGAIVTSKQDADLTAASGRALPARTFTFAGKDTFGEGKDIFGEGIVVASGRYLITVVATDIKSASTNPTGKRLAIKKFVSSLKIEK